VILGVDPGTTTGLAALDLRGKLLLLLSQRSADDSWIVSALKDVGAPIVVATDVVPPPSRVEKIAAQFGARLWVPTEKIRVAFKEATARKFGNAPKDDHQRDALSAAYAAYLQYAPKFRHVDAQYGHDPGLADFLKRAVVFGTPVSHALEEWERQEEVRSYRSSTSQKREDVSHLHEIIADLKKTVARKEREVSRLSKQLNVVREENARLKRLLRYVPSDERYQKMRMERDAAKRELKRIRMRLRDVLDAIDAVGRGEAIIVPLDRVPSGRILISTEHFAILIPEEDRQDAEELAQRILDLVEEYRRNRA